MTTPSPSNTALDPDVIPKAPVLFHDWDQGHGHPQCKACGEWWHASISGDPCRGTKRPSAPRSNRAVGRGSEVDQPLVAVDPGHDDLEAVVFALAETFGYGEATG